jgi:hypothetical protein
MEVEGTECNEEYFEKARDNSNGNFIDYIVR